MYGHISGLHANSMWNPRALDCQKRGWIGIKPNLMIHKIGDSLRISYRHKADDQARIIWYLMSIDQKLSSLAAPYSVSRWGSRKVTEYVVINALP